MITQISYYIAPALFGEITKESIIDLVCLKYHVTLSEMKTHSRKQTLTFPRHLCMYLLYKFTKLSLHQVGEIFDRDHTTVINAKNVIENYITTDSPKKKDIQNLIKRCEQRVL